jgi:O-antigen/teichoic acid export membrane protein
MVSAVDVSRGASYLTIETILTSAAQASAFVILAHVITPRAVGILVVISLMTAIPHAINGAAFQAAAIKYIGEWAGSDEGLAAGVFYQTLRVSLIISLPIAVFIFLESGFLAQMLLGTMSQARLFRALAIDALLYGGVLPVANGAVLGTKRFKEAAVIGTAGTMLRGCLIVLLALFLKDFVALIYAWVLSDFVVFVTFGLYAVRLLGESKSPFSLRRLMSFSWPLSVGNIVSFAYNWFDQAVLIAMVPLAALGVYNAALFAFGVLSNVSFAFGNVLLPVYSNIGGRNGLEGCRRATWLSSRYVSLVVAPLAFGLLATAKPALTVVVGDAYMSGVVPLMVLCLAFALTAIGLALSPMLTALAKTRAVMWINLVSAAVGLVSAYVLLPVMGIIGASVARGIATVASLGLTMFVLKRMDAMGVDVEMTWKSLVAGAAMAGVLIAAQMLSYSRILLPVYALLGVIVYMLLLRALNAVRKHDIDLIERYLGPRLWSIARLSGIILVRGNPKTD